MVGFYLRVGLGCIYIALLGVYLGLRSKKKKTAEKQNGGEAEKQKSRKAKKQGNGKRLERKNSEEAEKQKCKKHAPNGKENPEKIAVRLI